MTQVTDDGAAEPLPVLDDYEVLGVLGRGGEGGGAGRCEDQQGDAATKEWHGLLPPRAV